MIAENYAEDILALLTANRVNVPKKQIKRLKEDLCVLLRHIESDSKLEAIMHSNRTRYIEFKEQKNGRHK